MGGFTEYLPSSGSSGLNESIRSSSLSSTEILLAYSSLTPGSLDYDKLESLTEFDIREMDERTTIEGYKHDLMKVFPPPGNINYGEKILSSGAFGAASGAYSELNGEQFGIIKGSARGSVQAAAISIFRESVGDYLWNKGGWDLP